MILIRKGSVAYNLGYFEKDEEHERNLGLGMGPVFFRLDQGVVANIDRLNHDERVYLSVGRSMAGDEEYAPRDVRQKLRNRAGTDIVFPAPKSVSMAGLLFDDKGVLEDQQEAVRTAMEQVSKYFGYWKDSFDENGNPTGEREFVPTQMLYEERAHHLSRDGDPHIHHHNFVYNTCRDENGDLVRGQLRLSGSAVRHINALYLADLAARLRKRGYKVTPTRDSFEIGFTKEERLVFSKRTIAIEEDKAKYLWMKETKKKLSERGISSTIAGGSLMIADRDMAVASAIEGILVSEDGDVVGFDGFEYEKIKHEYLKRTSEVKGGSSFYRTRRSKDAGSIRDQWQSDMEELSVKAPMINRERSWRKEIDRDYGIQAATENRTLVNEEDLMAKALMRNLGRAEPDEIKEATLSSKSLVSLSSGEYTHINLLDDEVAIRDILRDGRGAVKPFFPRRRAAVSKLRDIAKKISSGPKPFDLTKEQWSVLGNTFLNKDRFIFIKGVAGSGKSTLLNFIREVCDSNRVGVRAMCTDGKLASDLTYSISKGRNKIVTGSTIASYVRTSDSNLLRGEILIVDEAAKLDTALFRELVEKAQRLDSRIIFVGDPERQFEAIRAGNPMRIVEQELGVMELTKSIRQKGAPEVEHLVHEIFEGRETLKSASENARMALQIKSEALKQTVENLNKRGSKEGVDFEAVRRDLELRYYKRKDQDVIRYGLERVQKHIDELKRFGKDWRKDLLVTADTNSDREEINRQMRMALKKRGLVGVENYEISGLSNISPSEIESKNIYSYQKGQLLSFSMLSDRLKERGLQKDHKYEIKRIDSKGEALYLYDGRRKTYRVPLNEVSGLALYEKEALKVSTGEKLIFKKNHESPRGNKRSNGEMVYVTGIDKGRIYYKNQDEMDKNSERDHRKDDYIDLSKDDNFVDYGYAITGYAAQGLTVDRTVTITRNKGNARHHYVNASRSREHFDIVGPSLEDYYRSVKREFSEGVIDLGEEIKVGGKEVNVSREKMNKLREAARIDNEKRRFAIKSSLDRSNLKSEKKGRVHDLRKRLKKRRRQQERKISDPFKELDLDLTMGLGRGR